MGQAQQIEYSVYVFHDGKSKKGKDKWEKVSVTENMDKAMKSAEDLINNRTYPKVEVKKKFFDEKNNRTVDVTLRVLEGKAKRSIGTFGLIVISLLLGVAAFGIAYFLGAPPPKT